VRRGTKNLYLCYLQQSYADGKVQFHGDLKRWSDPHSFAQYQSFDG
jgi:hypothetical protein